MNDVVKTYVASTGIEGVDTSWSAPVLPFILLDKMNTIFRAEILPLGGKFEGKAALHKWAKSYHAFNSTFFGVLSDDQQDRAIDIMDKFETYIGNDLVITEVTMMNLFAKRGASLDEQKIAASCMMCHILAQSSLVIWKGIYNKGNRYIDAIIYAIDNWKRFFLKGRANIIIDLNEHKEVENTVNALCRKMVSFLKIIDL